MVAQDLEARIERLEAIEAIKRLKAQYFEYCDRDYQYEKIAAMFAEDGVFEAGKFGTHRGQEQVRGFFSTISNQLLFAAHFGTNPIIDIQDADHATGRWRLLETTVSRVDGNKRQANWLVGAYEDQYVREGEVWKFHYMKLHMNFNEPVHGTWAESAVA